MEDTLSYMLSLLRLRRTVLVVALAIGVLSMHGLSTADGGSAHAPMAVVIDGLAGESHHESETDHAPLHAIGELCLWLIVGGAIVAVGARSLRLLHRRALLEYSHPVDWRATPPRPAGRSPDAQLIGVALRC
jgi:hypothetical protein